MRRITLIMREEMADCRLPIEAEAICPDVYMARDRRQSGVGVSDFYL